MQARVAMRIENVSDPLRLLEGAFECARFQPGGRLLACARGDRRTSRYRAPDGVNVVSFVDCLNELSLHITTDLSMDSADYLLGSRQ